MDDMDAVDYEKTKSGDVKSREWKSELTNWMIMRSWSLRYCSRILGYERSLIMLVINVTRQARRFRRTEKRVATERAY